MAETKTYYWLKLDKDFFEDDTTMWLEEQTNGKDYVLFYLKLCLKSLKDNGFMVRYVGERLMPYDVKALSKLTNTPVDTVAIALKLFVKIGLISIQESGEIYLNQIKEMIGTETDSAKRMRKKRIKDTKQLEETSQCAHNVQECDTEIEIEKELEIELEKDIEIETYSPVDTVPVTANAEQYPNIYKDVIDYLNEKANTSYRTTTKKTQQLIRCRQKEGFNLNDFKIVIDKKTKEWGKDSSMVKYLRPETLFGTKFEGYLNQKDKNIRENTMIETPPGNEEKEINEFQKGMIAKYGENWEQKYNEELGIDF